MDKAPEATRILIVEDEPEERQMLGEMVAIAGYRSEGVASGSEALARVREEPPDLILLDLNLLQMDGFEVCRHLKADVRTASVPVIIVTGLDDVGHKEEGLAAGADDYVTKPVNAADLLTRVRALLRVSHLSQELDRTLAYLQELEVARQAAAQAAADRGSVHQPGAAGAAHVLVVDDDKFVRQLYAGLLGGAGYRVTAVAGAAEAYTAAGRDVDVILLDIMMPGVSGLEALERLRQIAPEVPIIIVTAYQSVQHAIAALRGGAFDFIVKGMKSEMLLNTVERALDRRRLALENRRLMEALRGRLDAALAPPPAGVP